MARSAENAGVGANIAMQPELSQQIPQFLPPSPSELTQATMMWQPLLIRLLQLQRTMARRMQTLCWGKQHMDQTTIHRTGESGSGPWQVSFPSACFVLLPSSGAMESSPIQMCERGRALLDLRNHCSPIGR